MAESLDYFTLRDVADLFYTEKIGIEDTLIRYLKEGKLSACILYPKSDEFQQEYLIPASEWRNELEDEELEITGESNRSKPPKQVKWNPEFAYEIEVERLKKIAQSTISKKSVELKGLVSSGVIPTEKPTSKYKPEDWLALHQKVIEKLLCLESDRYEEVPVYVSGEEWNRFFKAVHKRGKGAGGKKVDPNWHVVYFELINLLAPTGYDPLAANMPDKLFSGAKRAIEKGWVGKTNKKDPPAARTIAGKLGELKSYLSNARK